MKKKEKKSRMKSKMTDLIKVKCSNHFRERNQRLHTVTSRKARRHFYI